MGKLTDLKRETLKLLDLQKHPVWTWDDDREMHVPVSEPSPSPEDYDTLFVEATFRAGDHVFEGYLIGGETFYAFALFVRDEKFVMNLNLPEEIGRDVERIFSLLNCEPFDLFPLRYESKVLYRGGVKISGMFKC